MKTPIFASVASIPEREDALRDAIDSIRGQVDCVFVYLNGYEERPAFTVYQPDVVASLSSERDSGDLGDAGKFFRLGRLEPCFFLTIDDDLIYPEDYVETLVSIIEIYERKAAIGFHGWNAKPNQRHYHDDRAKTLHFENLVKEDEPVHVLATCALGFYSSSIDLSINDFHSKNVADFWFSVACNRQRVQRIVAAHPKGWIEQNESVDLNRSIFSTQRADAKTVRELTEALNAIPWTYSAESIVPA